MKYIQLISFLMITASASAQNAEEIIRRNIAAFSENLVAGDFEAVANAYTEDAKLMPPGMSVIQGREAIQEYWTPRPETQSRTIDHQITPEEISIEGNSAYDWGYYSGKTQNADGTVTPWQGKYVIIWKKVSSRVWKIYLDMWSRV